MHFASRQVFIDDIEIQGDNLNALFTDLNDAALLETKGCAGWSIKDMLDSDLAKLFGVPTKRVNEAVRRGKARFPEEFAFPVVGPELTALRSQIATLKSGRGRHRKHPPCAFTEHGAIMLATVLNSPRAIKASIYIVKAFVRLRELMFAHMDLGSKLQESERKVLAHDRDIQGILDAIRQLMTPPPALPKRIGFSRD